MPILEFDKFAELKNRSKPILSLDLGERVIGVSISDSSWMIASPLTAIENKKFTSSAEAIFKIMNEREAIGIVIGLPVAMDGGENKRTQSARQFGRNMLKMNDVNIHFSDERFSTALAQQSLDNADISYDRKLELIDKVAAAYILQNFLDKIKD